MAKWGALGDTELRLLLAQFPVDHISFEHSEGSVWSDGSDRKALH